MSAPTFNLNSSAGMKPPSGAASGKYINRTGKYVGTFASALWIDKPSGSGGVQLDFRADNGRVANRLTIWTRKKNGDPNYWSVKDLEGLLAAMGVAEITPENVLSSDGMKTGYPAICNKQVGLLLVAETYERSDGGVGTSMRIDKAFMPDGRTVEEAALGQAAEEIDARLRALIEKEGGQSAAPAPDAPAATSAPPSFAASKQPEPESFDPEPERFGDDDDIPF